MTSHDLTIMSPTVTLSDTTSGDKRLAAAAATGSADHAATADAASTDSAAISASAADINTSKEAAAAATGTTAAATSAAATDTAATAATAVAAATTATTTTTNATTYQRAPKIATKSASTDDDFEFKDLRRHSNGYSRTAIRPFSLQDDRILERARSDTLAHIKENSTEVLAGVGTDAGRPLTVPPRRSKSSLNGRLSGSAQMLNSEGTPVIGDIPPGGGMGGSKTLPRLVVKQTALSTTGEDPSGASPLETFRRSEDISNTSAISDIPNNSAAIRYRNHINSSTSPGNTVSNDLQSNDKGLDSTPISTLRQNDKGMQISTVPKAVKAQKGRFVKVFPEIAEVDMVIKSYHCALVGDILLQGFLYVTSKWFCFHSKLMGKKRIAIPVSMVTNITKKKTAIIIPNAISIATAKEKFLFGSLMSRDNTYDLMLDVWKQNQQSQQEFDLEQNGENHAVVEEEEHILSKSMTSTHTHSSEDSVTLASSSDSYASSSHTLPSPGGPPDRPPAGRADGNSSRTGGACTCHSTPQRANLKNTGRTHGDTSLLGSMVGRPLTFWAEIITWMKSLPRNFLILSISTVLVIFLLFSALLLAYKLVQLQTNIRPPGDVWGAYPPRDQFSSNPSSAWRSESSDESSATNHLHHRLREADEELMYRRQEYHFTAIERINSVLESHIHMLDQINEAMRSLKQIAASTCYQSSSDPVTSEDESASSMTGETSTNTLHDEM